MNALIQMIVQTILPSTPISIYTVAIKAPACTKEAYYRAAIYGAIVQMPTGMHHMPLRPMGRRPTLPTEREQYIARLERRVRELEAAQRRHAPASSALAINLPRPPAKRHPRSFSKLAAFLANATSPNEDDEEDE